MAKDVEDGKKGRRGGFQEADAELGRESGEQHCKTEGLKEGGNAEEEKYGTWKTIKRQDPREPSKEEKEEHGKTHIPFRSWCRHCVRGRGKEEACRDAKRGHEVAEVHMDFMFMGDEGS